MFRCYAFAFLFVLLLAFCGGSLAIAAVTSVDENSTSDTTYDASANPADLANSGQPTFVSVTTTRNPTFGFGGLNNGAAGTDTTNSAFYRNTELSSSVTFTLNTTLNPDGYDIQTIRSLAGWTGANQTQANQKYELLTSQVGSPSFTSHGLFEESPFSAATTAASSTRITVTDTTGTIASNVDVVRFNLFYPGFTGNNSNPGTVFRELDVEGVAASSAAPVAPVNLIQNGSFETPVLGAGGFSTNIAAIPDWTISGELTLVNGTFGTVASDGNQWLSLESNASGFPNNVGSISQDIATEVGATYELSFDYNALGNSAVTTPWELIYDFGDGPMTLTIDNPAQLTLGAWLHESIEFIADGPLTTISFTGEPQVGGFYGAAIDNVSVVQTAAASVPEPTSVLLWLGVAGVALLAMRRNRRQAAP